jgi:hypothetical protein
MKKLMTIATLSALSLSCMTGASIAQEVDVANEGKNKIWRSEQVKEPAMRKSKSKEAHQHKAKQPQLRACLTYDGITCATFGPQSTN